ncbi:hypothetical protein [Naasia aerilata]|uniref:Uncharacterized protein n=1 Tax=Naasia aerilata TaxID=1162966 RepID=A0ABM8GGB9_9MICO|nr:hypothetical protein [Naasia aerilata]BDZ47143.1 hypothetical protein GCM10025866_30520 [Naasia aerilata]
MTTLASRPAARAWLAPVPVRWHRPLVALAAAMAVLAVVSAIGMLVDPRQVTGLSVWAKPLKFALSTGIYAVTFAWLIGQLPRGRRLARRAGTITTAGLAIELAIIVGVAAIGETSHFNVATPLHVALWAVMAGTIGVVWVMSLLVAFVLLRTPLGDPARTLAIRAGSLLAVVGMALAFLMTFGNGADYAHGIAGAHTVGLADGGPGLPLLGWSTVGGDLRIPHFVGMHALQALPLVAIALELVGRRVRLLAAPVPRLRLVAVAAVAYAATVALVTWQALAGQSVVAPSGGILVAGLALAVAAAGAVTAILIAARRSSAIGGQPTLV